MFNIRPINRFCFSLGRNIRKISSFQVCQFLQCVQRNNNLSKNISRDFHSSYFLLSSENVDDIKNNMNSDDNKNVNLDLQIGKYIELATDDEQKKKILSILMEHEVAKFEGKRVPSKITVQDMKELLCMYSFSSRIKYWAFLSEKEARRNCDKRKKEFKRKERQEWLIEKQNLKPPEHIKYGIGHNTMVLRVRKKSVNRVANQRMANSVLYGQKLIIDMDYDCFMRKQDCRNCAEQLLELYSSNRKSCYPFDLHFSNVDLSSSTMSSFQMFMPNLYAPDNFITLSELSYLDMFPKEKLVYITPFAKEPLKKYDHDAIYILGGLVDKCIKEPVVLAKAKREGIRAVHLPFDEYLMWGRSNKSLPLNQLTDILLEMKRTNDWSKAFLYVPQRKLVRSLDLFSEF